MVLFLLVLRDLGDHKVALAKYVHLPAKQKEISENIAIVCSWTKALEEIILQVTKSYQIPRTNF